MDIHFVNTVLTVPRDHPRWETELLTQLAGVASRGSASGEHRVALAPDGNSFLQTCDERREWRRGARFNVRAGVESGHSARYAYPSAMRIFIPAGLVSLLIATPVHATGGLICRTAGSHPIEATVVSATRPFLR